MFKFKLELHELIHRTFGMLSVASEKYDRPRMISTYHDLQTLAGYRCGISTISKLCRILQYHQYCNVIVKSQYLIDVINHMQNLC